MEDKKSIIDCCIFVGENLIFWYSKKQTVVTKSNAESEYKVMIQTVAEIT